jgi:hypothetical protein
MFFKGIFMTTVPELRATYAKSKLVGMTAGSFLFVLIGVGMASGVIHDDRKDGTFIQFIGYASIVFFGAVGVVWCRRLFRGDRPVVIVSPQGFYDERIASAIIPWAAIRQIGVASIKGQRFIVLDVAPDVEARLPLTWITKWSRGANRGMGVDGLCVVATGLTVTHAQLLEAIGHAWRTAVKSGGLAAGDVLGVPRDGRIEPTF